MSTEPQQVNSTAIEAVAKLLSAVRYQSTVLFLYDENSRGAQRQAWQDLKRDSHTETGRLIWEVAKALGGPDHTGTTVSRLCSAQDMGLIRALAAIAALRERERACAQPAYAPPFRQLT